MSRPPLIRAWLSLGGGAALVLFLLLAGYGLSSLLLAGPRSTFSVSDATECLRAGAAVYFNVTLGTESYLKKMGEWATAQERNRLSQAFVVSANTHVGTIRELSLKDRIFLETEGRRYPAAGRPLASTTHHDTYLVFFPRYDMAGQPIFDRKEGSFNVVIEGIGGIPKRSFTFRHPLPGQGPWGGLTVRQTLLLLVAVMAALLVSCTPCLVGSLLVGSVAMGSSWGAAAGQKLNLLRGVMARRTLIYLASVVVCYAAVTALINVFGLRAEDLRPVEMTGGVVLLLMGVWLALGLPAVAGCAASIPWLGRIIPAPLGPGSSAAMGGSLAMVCSVAGAPTLTTAIILPVMVYAGLTDLSWSLFLVVIYLLVCAFPFFFVAMGFGEALLHLSYRFQKAILGASSAVLILLGAVLLLDSERVAGIISLPAQMVFKGVQWLI